MLQEMVRNDGPPFDPAAVPDVVTLALDRARLRLAWRGGEERELSAGRLRAACRCAWCTRARIEGTAAVETVTIESVTPVGGYAVNLRFSDGHARGIYPWTYLRRLAQLPESSDDAIRPAQHHDGPSA
jgi:DUF971 family protein